MHTSAIDHEDFQNLSLASILSLFSKIHSYVSFNPALISVLGSYQDFPSLLYRSSPFHYFLLFLCSQRLRNHHFSDRRNALFHQINVKLHIYLISLELSVEPSSTITSSKCSQVWAKTLSMARLIRREPL